MGWGLGQAPVRHQQPQGLPSAVLGWKGKVIKAGAGREPPAFLQQYKRPAPLGVWQQPMPCPGIFGMAGQPVSHCFIYRLRQMG